MGITPSQIQMAERQQFLAARDTTNRVRLIAGPGTGKSRCIEERVNFLLGQGVSPGDIFVISFTRATAGDLKERIVRHCGQNGNANGATGVNVSTMHSLALRALRGTNLLQGFANDPCILDEWEQDNIFDAEFSKVSGVSPGRAEKIRLAYDAHWQTLQRLQLYSTPPPSPQEQKEFTSFHNMTRQLYCCLLPGEVVRVCVDEMRMSNINPAHVPGITHLVVDEYQDLNQCDQEFVEKIASAGATLFVAGDDDQSIYSFRHAAPIGIQNFTITFPGASQHQLQHCFRCTPSVLTAADSLMVPSPNRLPKNLQSLYGSSNPPVQGSFKVWRFATGVEEARGIAQSCHLLIRAGMDPKEILVLVANKPVQLPLITDEMQALNLPFERPRGGWMLDSDAVRLVFSILRIIVAPNDYVAHRTLLGLQHGVGAGSCAGIARKVLGANLNFRNLFYMPYAKGVFASREDQAIQRTGLIVQQVSKWTPKDTIQSRASDLAAIVATSFNASSSQTGQAALQEWQALASSLPSGMNLEEVYSYLRSETEEGQSQVLSSVAARLGLAGAAPGPGSQQHGSDSRIRVLTMHGAKGLSGRVVFIPGVETGIIPSTKALQAPGKVEEYRRLLYVSITRARASCILSVATTRTGPQAFALHGKASATLRPSQFITDIGIPPQPRVAGFSPAEVKAIMADCSNL